MNPFIAKLTAIFEMAAENGGWVELNETVFVFGWDGTRETFLIARERGELEIHHQDRVKLRLLQQGKDIIPVQFAQQQPGPRRG